MLQSGGARTLLRWSSPVQRVNHWPALLVMLSTAIGSMQRRLNAWSHRGTWEVPSTIGPRQELHPHHPSASQPSMDRLTLTGFIAALLLCWLPGGLIDQGRAHHGHDATTTQHAAR